MADFKKIAIATILADGKIDEAEVKALRKELWADGKIDSDEVKFLIELRNAAQKKAGKKGRVSPSFEKLFFKAIEQNVLKDGKIDAAEARWLRAMLFADGKIDANESKFLNILKKKARSTHGDFNKLYDEAMAKAKAARARRAKAARAGK